MSKGVGVCYGWWVIQSAPRRRIGHLLLQGYVYGGYGYKIIDLRLWVRGKLGPTLSGPRNVTSQAVSRGQLIAQEAGWERQHSVATGKCHYPTSKAVTRPAESTSGS